MVTLLIIVFFITLFYQVISGRLFICLNLLVVQGLLLFFVAFFELKEISIVNLAIILLETLVFKALILPLYLKKLVRRNQVKRRVEPYISGFNSLLIVSVLIIASLILAFYMQTPDIRVSFLAAAFSGIATGLFLVVSRKEIIMHLIGYIVLENGIVFLTFSLGDKFPFALNAGVMLDIFISILVFGLFLDKIQKTYKNMEITQLHQLQD